MVMSIDNLTIPSINTIMYMESMHNVLESHLWLLRQDTRTRVIMVSEYDRIKYRFNLTGYLLSLKIQIHKHWLIMRCSNIKSNTDFGDDTSVLYIPDDGVVNHIVQVHQSEISI